MRGLVAPLGLLVAATACGGEPGGLLIDLSTRVTPIDRVTITVVAPEGARVRDRVVPEGGAAPDLPATVRLDTGDRREHLVVLAWGFRAGARVAFGAAEVDAAPGRDQTVPVILDAPPADRDQDAVPDAWDGCPDDADPAQEDADLDRVGDACDEDAPDGGAAPCPGNLLANGDFETGTTMWISGGGEITWAEGGRGGGHAARSCKTPTGTLDYYTTREAPPSVTDPPLGATYHVEAWVRAEVLAPTQNVRPRLRELDAAENEVAYTANNGVVLTTDWQRLELELTVQAAGSSAVEVWFSSVDAEDGSCFLTDDVCLTRGN